MDLKALEQRLLIAEDRIYALDSRVTHIERQSYTGWDALNDLSVTEQWRCVEFVDGRRTGRESARMGKNEAFAACLALNTFAKPSKP